MSENIENTINGLCSDCNEQRVDNYWCQNCSLKRFQKEFGKWTSGNTHIDKFIQDAQLKARNYREVIEWIPYDHLRNIQYLAEGGFSTVYKAIWLDGYIKKWDSENNQWQRNFISLKDKDYKNAKNDKIRSPLDESDKNGLYVVLKSLNNSSNINEDFLIEWKKYLEFICLADKASIFLFGITRDPKTLNYMIVLEEIKNGNLRSNLMIKKYNPNDKYRNLYFVARSLSALHDYGLVHGDFHSGNLLLWDQKSMYISDFGLSRPADKPNNSNEIYGVLPFIAPEVLRGESYTIAADIYSFGIIMWEMTSGIPAFNNLPHDFKLALSICRGLRPNIIKGTMSEYVELMKKCWNHDPNKRPTAKELNNYFSKWYNVYYKSKYIRIPVSEDEPAVINHPLSCYKSRIFDFTVKLNEILNQEELSSNKTGLTKELESCRVSSISELEGNSPISDNNKTELMEDLGSYNITKYYNKTELTEDMESCLIVEKNYNKIGLTEDSESCMIIEKNYNKTGLTENLENYLISNSKINESDSKNINKRPIALEELSTESYNKKN